MAVSKRLKFEILRRDGFACQYCGAKAPETTLTVDHVTPVALGGTDEPTNLAAACGDCNNGKTSSAPDAPLVEQVSNDAVRWAAAIRAASARMLANIDARNADRAQFRKWWGSWGTGTGEDWKPIPLEPDWETTVDQFLAAGLPLPVLKTCIDLAMRRQKVQPEQTFRYMCGVAWKKVAELRDIAGSIAAGDPGAGKGPVVTETDSDEEELPPVVVAGRASLAREMLGDLGPDEMNRLLAEARDEWEAETDEEQAIGAIQIAWLEHRIGLNWMVATVCDMLMASQDEAITEALTRTRRRLFDEEGPGFLKDRFAQAAVDEAIRVYEENDARAYLSWLSDDEQAEWAVYANAVYGAPGQPLSGYLGIVGPARCARAVKQNGVPLQGMCQAGGEHTERCPRKVTQALCLAECKECAGSVAGHEHLLCEQHADKVEAGEVLRNGKRLTVISRQPAEVEKAVPF